MSSSARRAATIPGAGRRMSRGWLRERPTTAGLAGALGLMTLAACRPTAEQGPSVEPEAPAGEGVAEAYRDDYPDRESPYDAYRREARMSVKVAMRDPAELGLALIRLSDLVSTSGPLKLDSLLRETLHDLGVPTPVLEQVDPHGDYGVALSYPFRDSTAPNWARVPAKDEGRMAQAVVEWLTLDALEPRLWGRAPGPGPGEGPIDDEGMELLVQARDGAMVFASDRAHLSAATSPRSEDGGEHALLVELEGVSSAIPDLLEDLDSSLHAPDRETWSTRLAALDRLWLTVDHEASRELEFGLGAVGRFEGWDGGLLGPARTAPAAIAEVMPGEAVVGMTMSWGNPAPFLTGLGDFRPTLGSSALEREYLDIAAEVVDHVVEDVGFAVYVDPAGRHTFLLAAKVEDADGVGATATRFIELLDRSMRAYDAGITAREVSKEIDAAAAKSMRRGFARRKLKLGKGTVPGFWVEFEDEMGTWAIALDDRKRMHVSAFVKDETLFVLFGPGLEGTLRAMGRKGGARFAESAGLRAAHERLGGCQVCGMSDGGLVARSLFGRVARLLPEDRRREARALLPKLEAGGEGSFLLRATPSRIEARFATDRASVAADPEQAAAWEAFMKALGHRGEGLADPREWLFGLGLGGVVDDHG